LPKYFVAFFLTAVLFGKSPSFDFLLVERNSHRVKPAPPFVSGSGRSLAQLFQTPVVFCGDSSTSLVFYWVRTGVRATKWTVWTRPQLYLPVNSESYGFRIPDFCRRQVTHWLLLEMQGVGGSPTPLGFINQCCVPQSQGEEQYRAAMVGED
jgi:hypothetical protein